jgi:hypothetical protein
LSAVEYSRVSEAVVDGNAIGEEVIDLAGSTIVCSFVSVDVNDKCDPNSMVLLLAFICGRSNDNTGKGVPSTCAFKLTII